MPTTPSGLNASEYQIPRPSEESLLAVETYTDSAVALATSGLIAPILSERRGLAVIETTSIEVQPQTHPDVVLIHTLGVDLEDLRAKRKSDYGKAA